MKLGGNYNEYFTVIKSVTKELKNTIQNPQLRKYVTKIWMIQDKETEEISYAIFFKAGKVKNSYDDEYFWEDDFTESPNEDINGWLEEITYIPEVEEEKRK